MWRWARRAFTAEHRAEISATLLGRKLMAEHRANVSAALIGKPRSDDVRAKISAGHKALAETEHLRRLHSLGGRTGGRRWRGRWRIGVVRGPIGPELSDGLSAWETH
jgi:hypothetical protein